MEKHTLLNKKQNPRKNMNDKFDELAKGLGYVVKGAQGG
jgi:hypothetical protein